MELSKGVKLMCSPEQASKLGSGIVDHTRRGYHSEQLYQKQNNHPKSRIVKMLIKVQVVYYLTRNGHLEHPHYIEVSHLATQPLRLKDVLERLALLRGKAMPCQYSWSCKRSYKNGYVWNDLTENDAIYATEGSEYVLKGSELMQDSDFSDIRYVEHQPNGRKQSNCNPKSPGNALITSKSHQRHSFRQPTTNQDNLNCEENVNGNSDEYESEEEDEKRVSCNSTNASYAKPINNDNQIMMQLDQEESFSIPSTSSTISDKPPLPPPEKTPPKNTSISKRFEESFVIEEDGDPQSTALSRNPLLLQLIACGGVKAKKIAKGSHKGNFNYLPCLKPQSSTRGVSVRSRYPVRKETGDDEKELGDSKEVLDDQDMIMVRFMSENPRFGNLQSQEKEYFSGTIVETIQHTPSFGSESGFGHGQGQGQGPVFTKSSSYNELRSSKAGLEAATLKTTGEDDEVEEAKVKGMIKLCLPRKKSGLSNPTKSNTIT